MCNLFWSNFHFSLCHLAEHLSILMRLNSVGARKCLHSHSHLSCARLGSHHHTHTHTQAILMIRHPLLISAHTHTLIRKKLLSLRIQRERRGDVKVWIGHWIKMLHLIQHLWRQFTFLNIYFLFSFQLIS